MRKSTFTVKDLGQVSSFAQLYHVLRILTWLFGIPSSPATQFLKRIEHIWNKNGKTFTVLYLKECCRILQHYLSGNLAHLSQDVPLGIVGGLPSIIPGIFRAQIRAGELGVIRFTYTILSLYRVLKIPGKLKLGTISDTFKGQSMTLPQLDLANGLKSLLTYAGVTSWRLEDVREAYLDIVKSGASGPNDSSSFLGIFKDLVAFERSPLIKKAVLTFGKSMPNVKLWLDFLFQFSETMSLAMEETDLYLGRLSVKEEAAGKLRVFAITDVITQTVLRPLHKSLMKILREIPMDGTFNQAKPIERLVQLHNEGKLGKHRFHSFDLSAATDRLPVKLQSDIIAMLYQNEEMGESWATLLTQRDWVLLSNDWIDNPVTLRYSVGQPMGALSSWPMLALTHHVIVQIAALRVGIYNFCDYALLGDDIVIANDEVAREYHRIMTAVLGVEINDFKSLVSDHCFEFAKRLVSVKNGGTEYSAVSPANAVIALKSIKGIPALLLDAKLKGLALEEKDVDLLLKKIPTVSPKRWDDLLWVIKGPFGFIPTASGLTSSMKLVNSLSAVRMDSLINSIDTVLYENDRHEFYQNVRRSAEVLYLFNSLPIPFGSEEIHYTLQVSLAREYNELLRRYPRRKFIFDGPLIFTNFYREGWMKEVMGYIVKKIKTFRYSSTSLLDPFDSEVTRLPGLSTKGKDFFTEVRRIEREKDLQRGY